MLSLKLIEEASSYIQSYIRKTPCEYSPALSKQLDVPVYLKLEFLQITGSFKPRGALFRLSKLTEAEKQKGVVTCSAGNHGKAVAYVAKQMGIKATVFVPKNVDKAKLEGILSYGAEVIVSPFIGYDETDTLAQDEAKKQNRPFISPFDDVETMAANGGTIAMEILQDCPDARTVILPVGGGGLGAGLSLYMKEKVKHCHIIACQHQGSPGLKLSLERGTAVTKLPPIETSAGGIEGGIGANCFHYLQSRIDDVLLVSEDEIKQGMIWMLEHHQYLIEPSSAAAIAAAMQLQPGSIIGPCVLVLTGRNVSKNTLLACYD